MAPHRRRQGSATAVVLGVLVVISFLFAGTVLYLEITSRGLRRHREEVELRAAMVEKAGSLLGVLADDPTPFADASRDPVWNELARLEADGGNVELEDLSSRLGLNWVRKELLERLDVLRAGQSAGQLQQYREDTGIHLNLVRAFAGFIPEQLITELFTPYAYFNLNTADEFVLRKLYALRTGDSAAAEVFRTKIQSLRIERKELSARELPSFLGQGDFEVLFPVLNCEPGINVHFAPERLLMALFSYYDLPLDKVRQIVSVRESTEWSQESLASVIGPGYADSALDQYLGVRTWFWGITVSADHARLRWVVARAPEAEGTPGEPAFRLLEEEFSP